MQKMRWINRGAGILFFVFAMIAFYFYLETTLKQLETIDKVPTESLLAIELMNNTMQCLSIYVFTVLFFLAALLCWTREWWKKE